MVHYMIQMSFHILKIILKNMIANQLKQFWLEPSIDSG